MGIFQNAWKKEQKAEKKSDDGLTWAATSSVGTSASTNWGWGFGGGVASSGTFQTSGGRVSKRIKIGSFFVGQHLFAVFDSNEDAFGRPDVHVFAAAPNLGGLVAVAELRHRFLTWDAQMFDIDVFDQLDAGQLADLEQIKRQANSFFSTSAPQSGGASNYLVSASMEWAPGPTYDVEEEV